MGDLMVGRVITGKFKILSQVDSGGMGSVFKAYDSKLGRTVAIKRINAELIGDPEARQRFESEARAVAAAAQDNGNVANIYDFVEEDGEPFLVMEFVEGVDLHDLIVERGALPVNVTATLVCGILRGLAAAHKQGIVHRDIKPKNVRVSNSGEPKIIDFGIARMTSRAGLTQFGQTLGTPVYMSPEQIFGEQIDGRSDLYSLAVVLFEMLTGQPPFPEDGSVPPMKAHIETPAQCLSSRRKGLPPKLDGILTKGLAKERDKRYQTAEDFLAALEGALTVGTCSAKAPAQACVEQITKRGKSVVPEAAAPPPTEYAVEAGGRTVYAEEVQPRKKKIRGWHWAVAAAVLLLAGIGITAMLWNSRSHPAPRPAVVVPAVVVPAIVPPPSTDVSLPADAGPPAGTPPARPASTAPPSVTNPPTPAAAALNSAKQVDNAPLVKPKAVDAVGTPATAPTKKAATKAIDEAEKKRIDTLKALGEYKEQKKDK